MNADRLDKENNPQNYEALLQENLALRQEMEGLKTRIQAMWSLMAETGRRLQVSSASIKAAVSSLLSYDIFWDSANQHEFLETIDNSNDQIARQVTLLALAFRSEAGKLGLESEPHLLQEILLRVQDSLADRLQKLTLEIQFPREGRPVLVDYQYLSLALQLLFEAVDSSQGPAKVLVQAVETEASWHLDFDGIEASYLDYFQEADSCRTDFIPSLERISTENALRLYVACRLLCRQSIDIRMIEVEGGQPRLRLVVPISTAKIGEVDISPADLDSGQAD
jgi:hypothetical protein